MNTYETQLHKIKNDNWELDKVSEILENYDNIINTFKMQLNIYWIEINKKKDKDQIVIDLEDTINIGIIRHKSCLFKFIKNMGISVIDTIQKIKLENINNFDEFVDRIAKITHAILMINKESTLDEEDDFDCNGCENVQVGDIFWE